MKESDLFQPEFLNRFAAELVRRLPPHICALNEGERVYVKAAAARQARLFNAVGVAVITACASAVLALIALGFRVWASRGGATP